MFHWYPVHPDFSPYPYRVVQGRVEAQGRVTYLFIVAVDAAVTVVARRAVSILRRAARAIGLWRRRRQTVLALSRLDAHMLRDVGIDPFNIEWVAATLTSDSAPAPAAEPTLDAPRAPPRLRLDLDCPDLHIAA